MGLDPAKNQSCRMDEQAEEQEISTEGPHPMTPGGHKDDGVLLLKATYRIEILERREPKRTEVAAVSLMKKASEKV